MYLLEPIPHSTIWGGMRLNKYVADVQGRLGHLYMVNGHEEMANTIINGACRGKTLREIFPSKKKEWKMEKFEEFPLTIALVDATENLSIQVHPDDVAAEHIEKVRIGKTESWVFLEKPKAGWIYAGCQCGTKKEVSDAVAAGKMEQITGRLTIAKSDYVCIEAGTLHAMTTGSLVYEIEYGSGYTYRFYDYDRRDLDGNARELHIDKALTAIKPQNFPKARPMQEGTWMCEKNYEICQMRWLKEYKNNSEMLECVSLIEGNGICEGCEVKGGMSILLLPGEQLKDMELDKIMIARIKMANERAD